MKQKMLIFLLLLVTIMPIYAELTSSGFNYPIEKKFITSSRDNFGAYGKDYDPKSSVWHCGMDFVCPKGTKVYSISEGTIIGGSPSGWDMPANDKAGKRENFALVISHRTLDGRTYRAYLGHLKRPRNPKLSGSPMTDDQIRSYRKGEKVSANEIIGEIGDWSPCHLHFAVYYNITLSGYFPDSGFGRQPLPRPDRMTLSSVISYGGWQHPKAWIETFNPSGYIEPDIEHECFMATQLNDQNTVVYIRKDRFGQTLMAMNSEGKNKRRLWRLPAECSVEQMFRGPKDTFYMQLKEGEEYCLYQGSAKEGRKIFTNKLKFRVGPWREGISYMPYREMIEWQAFDLETSTVTSREDAINGRTSPWGMFGSIGGGSKTKTTWRILCTELDVNLNRKRIACWVISSNEQKRFWISPETFDEVDSISVLGNQEFGVNADKSEKIVFSLKDAKGVYQLTVGKITPANGDAIKSGYTLDSEMTKLSDSPYVKGRMSSDQTLEGICFDRGIEKILFSMKIKGSRQIWNINSEGLFLTQLTGENIR